jgi:hypothetical protein
MDANANGTISLTFKGKPALLGDGTPYLELIIRGICEKANDGTIKRIGGINIMDPANATALKNGALRLDFKDGRQLLLKPAGEDGGVAIVKPFGILLGIVNDMAAGQLLIGNMCLDVVYMGQDNGKGILLDIASGKTKIRDFHFKTKDGKSTAILTTAMGDQINLHICPANKYGRSVIERVVEIPSVF